MLKVSRLERSFIPNDLVIKEWDDISSYFETLEKAIISNEHDALAWLLKRSELESVLEEDMAWRYIKTTQNTVDAEAQAKFETFVAQIQPKISVAFNALDKKYLAQVAEFPVSLEGIELYKKRIQAEVDLFRPENVELIAEMQVLQQQYGKVAGGLQVEIDGELFTIQQAGKKLESQLREDRQKALNAIVKARAAARNDLDHLFDKLVTLRTRIANNAGFDNYRDYMFKAMGRFDYTPADCEAFHHAVKRHILPVAEQLHKKKAQSLKLADYSIADIKAPVFGKPLKPFETEQELIDKTIACFDSVHPEFGNVVKEMQQLKKLDLTSRKSKAPGGYNYPLYESGYPFIFMNAVGSLRDLVTMVHEGGHALHSVNVHSLPLAAFKSCPSEVAELASMAMELISMEHWEHFFGNGEDLMQAKSIHLEDALTSILWIAQVDEFQHWLYTHPNHTQKERGEMWKTLSESYTPSIISWANFEEYRHFEWQKQLHLFEVPFYYIEYGFAQLGAFQMWMNYRKNKPQTVSDYLNFQKLGYTKSIPETYQAAGIQFDFSEQNVKSIASFVTQYLGN